MEFYLTIPEKSGQSTCQSSGQDGAYKATWDGCVKIMFSRRLNFCRSRNNMVSSLIIPTNG